MSFMYVFAYGSKTVLIKRTFLLTGRRGLCWGGVGVLTFCLVRTVNVATLPRSLECLLHCYAAEISSAMECFLRYM